MKRFPVLIVAATALAVFASPAIAQTSIATAPTAGPTAGQKNGEHPHRLILQVNTNDPAAMNLALNNAANVDQYYSDKGDPVEIEIVTFGPGLNMLRDDTSPVKDRIKSMAESRPSISFKACGNTQAGMAKAENKKIVLLPQASVVKSGVVRVMELQEQGWSYVKP